MSDNKKSMPELAMALDIEGLESYFNSLNANVDTVKCPVCKSVNWAVAVSHDDKKKPMIVTLPIPQLQGKGVWNYTLICDTCGYTMLFNCSSVVRKLEASGKL